MAAGAEVEAADISAEARAKIQQLRRYSSILIIMSNIAYMSAELRYSVSMTAKRLSVMVTLSQEEARDPSKQGSWATINGRLVRYKVEFLDFDIDSFGEPLLQLSFRV